VKDTYKKERVWVYMEDYTPARTPVPRVAEDIIYDRDVHIWTDGSAVDNSSDTCSAGSAWTSDLLFDDKVQLMGAVLSNNVAEIAAVVLCLLAWRNAHIVIHTDSTLVLGLLRGGLLAMERDGWGEAPRHFSQGPPTPLLQYLLFLLRDRMGRISFIKAKAHSDDLNNNITDRLANKGRASGRVLDISTLHMPPGWVDTAPVLCHQPLDYLTRLVVRHNVPAPTGTIKFGRFSDRWTVMIGTLFDVMLDPGRHIGNVWHLNIPEGLKEVFWRDMNDALVLGDKYFGTRYKKSDMGRVCPCGHVMSLGHILLGCANYNLQPLLTTLLDALKVVSPASAFRTLHPDKWGSSPWYPLLALRAIEELTLPIFKGQKKVLKAFKDTRPRREWIVGNYYWMLWKWRMKEIHDDDFKFIPVFCTSAMEDMLKQPCLIQDKEVLTEKNERVGKDPRVRLTDHAYG